MLKPLVFLADGRPFVVSVIACAALGACSAPAIPVPIPASEFPVITPVSSTVPKDCAVFLGGWAGTWPYGDFGQIRLWVTHIDDSCVATYTYSGRAGTQKIVNGKLTIPCGGGTCDFSPSGDSLAAFYSQQVTQQTLFGRIVRAQ